MQKKSGYNRTPCSSSSIITASSIATLVNVLAMNPFELVKSKQQVTSRPMSILSTLRRVVTVNGPRALWRGWYYAFMSGTGVHITYFMMYENGKEALVSKFGMYGYGIAGALFKGVSVALFTPLEVAKTKQLALRTEKRHNVELVFRGMQAQVYNEVLYTAVLWQAMESSFHYLRDLGYNENLVIVGGSLVGATLANIATHPLDVLKTRLQTNVGGVVLSEFPLVGIHQLWKAGGLALLSTGIGSRQIKGVFGVTLFMFTYEKTKALLSRIY